MSNDKIEQSKAWPDTPVLMEQNVGVGTIKTLEASAIRIFRQVSENIMDMKYM